MPRDNNAEASTVAQWARALESQSSFTVSAHFPWLGACRVALIGAAAPGVHEFHRLRDLITRELVDRHNFTFLAVEADGPDAEGIDAYVRQRPARGEPDGGVFSRFPEWAWRNLEFLNFVEWLEQRNGRLRSERKTALRGLDFYGLHNSIAEILHYLDKRDRETGKLARERYSGLLPLADDAAAFCDAVMMRRLRVSEAEVAAMLADLLRRRIEQGLLEDGAFFDVEHDAQMIMNAERYYRAIYRGSLESWNVRDRHMFETLLETLEQHGPGSKAIIWAHNAHVGDTSATEMSLGGVLNLGQLCREHFGEEAGLIGMGAHCGELAAAPEWGRPVEIRQLNESLEGSYERLCHDTGIKQFSLNLRDAPIELKQVLQKQRLERAIGAIYNSDEERGNHYFHARLASQFDGWLWVDETKAITPLDEEQGRRLPAGHPLA